MLQFKRDMLRTPLRENCITSFELLMHPQP